MSTPPGPPAQGQPPQPHGQPQPPGVTQPVSPVQPPPGVTQPVHQVPPTQPVPMYGQPGGQPPGPHPPGPPAQPPWAGSLPALTPAAGPWDTGTARDNFGPVIVALAVGSLVAVLLGAYGGLHTPTAEAFNLAGFSSGLHAKAWLASVAFLLALVQLVTSLMVYGKLPGGGPVVAGLHRWSGRLAVLVSLPVAAHCLYALGFQSFDARVLLHSLLGCFFYGVFVVKMLVLTRDDSPGWVLPVAGGAVFTALTGLWVTSSVWFFSESGVSF